MIIKMSYRFIQTDQYSKEKEEDVNIKKQLTRREFLNAAVLAGAGAAVAACAPQAAQPEVATQAPAAAPTKLPAKDKIVVGMSRPLSGWNAKIGDSAYRPVYETFIAEVNAAGGIFVEEYGKKLPIEPLIYDDKSDVATMTMLT